MAKTRRYMYIDDELYSEFKRISQISGVTMTEVVNEAMKEYISAMKFILGGMSAGELIDYSHYKIYKAEKEVNKLINGKETKVSDYKPKNE